ncbi:hypothetical protein [uncultured Psychrobacter sp.]|uniref:hypothetical protein n=1 Tax=uncultured Psychrobacter sp. TaxID=259303 RepID=UPI00345A8F5C
MTDKVILEQLRNQLTDIKATTHDTVEPSVTLEIEKAIESIDSLLEDSQGKNYRDEALSILGKVLFVLPSIVELFNKLLE